MKEHKRKCFMCGSSSENPAIVLHRFPKPGSKNYLRCELWAKFCFPHGKWSSPDFQMKLYNEHRMLCHTHFKESSYVDFTAKKLRRHAAPEENFVQITQTLPQHSNEPVAVPSHQWPLPDVTNQAQSTRKSNEGAYEKIIQILPQHTNELVAGPSHQGPLSDVTNQAQSTRKSNEGAYHKIIQTHTIEPVAGPSHQCPLSDVTNQAGRYIPQVVTTPLYHPNEPVPGSSHSSPLALLKKSKIERDILEQGIVDAAELQACAYVCGFIIKKYKNQCSTCKESFIAKETDTTHLFVDFKEYSDLKKSLMYASRDFIICVKNCAQKVNSFLNEKHHLSRIKATIKILLGEIDYNFLNKCEKHKQGSIQYIGNSVFHICVKRYCILRNRKFAEEASHAALKKKIGILKHV